jgi:hypothetical protein
MHRRQFDTGSAKRTFAVEIYCRVREAAPENLGPPPLARRSKRVIGRGGYPQKLVRQEADYWPPVSSPLAKRSFKMVTAFSLCDPSTFQRAKHL